MYDLGNDTITLLGKTEKIERKEVWFQVPNYGITDKLEIAQQACKESDFDPKFCIIPVPVAVSATMHEILVK